MAARVIRPRHSVGNQVDSSRMNGAHSPGGGSASEQTVSQHWSSVQAFSQVGNEEQVRVQLDEQSPPESVLIAFQTALP